MKLFLHPARLKPFPSYVKDWYDNLGGTHLQYVRGMCRPFLKLKWIKL